MQTHPFLSLQCRHCVIGILPQFVVHVAAAYDNKPLVCQRDLEYIMLRALSSVATFSFD